MKAEFMKRRIQDGTVRAAPSGLFCAYYRLRLAFDGRAKSRQLSQPVAVSSSVNPVKLILGKVAASPLRSGGQVGATGGLQRAERTVRPSFTHFSNVNRCRPIFSVHGGRQASYGLYVIFYRWGIWGRGKVRSMKASAVALSYGGLSEG